MKQPIPRRTFLTSTVSGLAVVLSSRAQQPRTDTGDGADAIFSSDVSLVNVFATVRDKQGRIVPDLKKDDFELLDEGRKQAIGYFSRETDLPLTLGLLVDTSCSQRAVLQEEKTATGGFIRKVLREDKDRTFLLDFDAIAELVQDLTPDRAKLEAGLDRIHLPNCRMAQGGTPGNVPSGTRAVGTKLYDAVAAASDKIMRKRTGRKALILLTDGVDFGSGTALVDAIERAQRADTLVYSVLFEGDEYGGGGFGGGFGRGGFGGGFGGGFPGGVNGKEVLRRFSRETGGGFFEVSKKMSLEQIYERIEEELRSQYSLGFTPPKTDARPFHKLRISVKPKDMVVQTREGYYQGR